MSRPPDHVEVVLDHDHAAAVVDQLIQAFAYGLSKQLSIFVGLIITNCIVLGRAESFAMHNPVRLAALDGLGNGLGYSLVLIAVSTIRELVGSGTLLGVTVLTSTADGGWYDDPAQCPVAPVFRLGIYGINQLLRLCGKVEAVNVAYSRLFTGRPTPDNGELSLQFKNGALGSIFASFCIDDGHRYANHLCIHYARGTVRGEVTKTFDNHDMRAKKLSLQALDSDDQVVTRSVELETEQLNGKYQWKNFRDAVRSGQPLVGEIDPKLIAHTIQVINTMCEADREGRQIFVPELRSRKQAVERPVAMTVQT